MMVSADGCIEDTALLTGMFSMRKYMMGFFGTVDAFLYVRKSYDPMISYWPHETGLFADVMNQTPEIIFSRTLENVEWNSRLVKGNVAEEADQPKQQPEKMQCFMPAPTLPLFLSVTT